MKTPFGNIEGDYKGTTHNLAIANHGGLGFNRRIEIRSFINPAGLLECEFVVYDHSEVILECDNIGNAIAIYNAIQKREL